MRESDQVIAMRIKALGTMTGMRKGLKKGAILILPMVFLSIAMDGSGIAAAKRTETVDRVGGIAQPVWSPSGQAVAFVYAIGGNSEIYVVKADGSQPKNVSNNPGVDINPVWSYSGDSLLYSSHRGGQFDIYRVDVKDGRPGSPRRITRSSSDELWAAWSPDGSTIAYCGYDAGYPQVFFSDADGNNRELFYEKRACYPSFSADGKSLALSSMGDIIVFKLKNRKSENITEGLIEGNMVDDTFPVWAPRGNRIAFAGMFEANSAELYTISSAGKKVRRITDDLFENFYPRWSPGGKGIVYAAYVSGRAPEIFISEAEAPVKTRLTENHVVEMSPSFSPDGSSILYIRREGIEDALYIMNSDGSGQRPFLKDKLPTVADLWEKKKKEMEKNR